MNAPDPSLIGGDFRYLDRTVGVPFNQSIEFVPANSNRVSLNFQIISGQGFTRPIFPASVTEGFKMDDTFSPINFSFSRDGALTCQAWNIFSALGCTIYVVEVLYEPKKGG